MTPPPDPADLPGPWPDVLAAYADGELDERARAAVERWLAANPCGRDCVRAQQSVSPENWRLWRDAEPPRPSPADWERVRAGIAAGHAPTAEPASAAPRWKDRLGWTLAATAFGFALFAGSLAAFGPWLLPLAPQQVVVKSGRPAADDPLAGFAVLPIATEAEVDVRRVDGAAAGGWLPVGGMPLAAPLALATADDVDLEEAEEHPAWPTGFPRVTRDPADMPILYPATSR